jgi:hypothetical protein
MIKNKQKSGNNISNRVKTLSKFTRGAFQHNKTLARSWTEK